jgi:DNA-binding response OmpR family regulator
MAAILLIEDDPHQRAFAALVLTGGGHTVREAGNGEEGLRMALEQPPELIVCDVVMPTMNGYQLVAAVRERPSIGAVPVILLTSLGERTQVRVGMNAGADDYLPKPFRPPELLEAVASLLRRRKTQYEAIAGSLMEDMDAALAQQRELLASRYESRLLHELNSKWKVDVEAGREIAFDAAVVLVADLFRVVERAGAGQPEADLLKRAHEAARDVLYLFGAAHVLHHGPDIVAVFRADTQGRPNLANPVRAAFGLLAATTSIVGTAAAGLAVALEAGPVSLLRLTDPLHGDAGAAPVPGATLQRAEALRGLAQAQGWQLATSASLAESLPQGTAVPGRRTRAGELQVVELLRSRE